MFILSTKQFNAIQSVSPLEGGTYTRRTMKVNILEKIEEALPEVELKRLPKVMLVIDEIVYKLTDRGFSFNGRKQLAEKCEVGLSTVDKAIYLLKATGLFLFTYRMNPNSNSAKTPVIFYIKHSNYKTYEKLIPTLADERIDQEISRLEKVVKQSEEQKEEKRGNAWESKNKGGGIFSTNIFTKNHDKQNKLLSLIQKVSNLSTNQNVSSQMKKIVEYLTLKIQKAIDSGVNVEFLGAYCEKMLSNELKTAIRTDKKQREKERQTQQQEQKKMLLLDRIALQTYGERFEDLGFIAKEDCISTAEQLEKPKKQAIIPFFDWVNA